MPLPPSRPTGPQHARRHARRGHRRLRRWPRRLLITANVLTVLLLATAGSITGYALSIIDQIHHTHVSDLIPTGHGKQSHAAHHVPAFTILIIGSDTRKLSKATGLNIGNDQSNAEDLSDSIILARIAPDVHRVALLSIPRDLFVDVPGLGEQKINSAFAGNDASRLISVIEHQIGVEVNHFVEINFDTFEEIADDIGGVEQFFPSPAYDLESGLQVPKAGCVLLKGAQALAFVRSRNFFSEPYGASDPILQTEPESDLGRIQRQQAFIKNAIHKAERTGALTNIGTLTSIINSVTSNLTVDSGFSDTDLLGLAEDFAHIDANAIPNLTYPTQNIPAPDGDSPGLEGIPGADAAAIAQFLAIDNAPAPRSPVSHPTSTASVPAATTTTTLAPSGISVAVENGSGAAGQAGQAATDLEGAGFTVSGSSDATSFSHDMNVVEYGPSGRDAAMTLRDHLVNEATLQADPTLAGHDLILVTGTDFGGVTDGTTPTGPSVPSTPTTAAPTTTTTVPAAGTPYASAMAIVPYSSSFYHGVYIAPGRVPGQKVRTCGN